MDLSDIVQAVIYWTAGCGENWIVGGWRQSGLVSLWPMR
jgi:hypothetical protein